MFSQCFLRDPLVGNELVLMNVKQRHRRGTKEPHGGTSGSWKQIKGKWFPKGFTVVFFIQVFIVWEEKRKRKAFSWIDSPKEKLDDDCWLLLDVHQSTIWLCYLGWFIRSGSSSNFWWVLAIYLRFLFSTFYINIYFACYLLDFLIQYKN